VPAQGPRPSAPRGQETSCFTWRSTGSRRFLGGVLDDDDQRGTGVGAMCCRLDQAANGIAVVRDLFVGSLQPASIDCANGPDGHASAAPD